MTRRLGLRLVVALLAGCILAAGLFALQTRRSVTLERSYDMPAGQVRQFVAAATVKFGWKTDPTDLGSVQTPDGRLTTEVSEGSNGALVHIEGPRRSAEQLVELLSRQLPESRTGE